MSSCGKKEKQCILAEAASITRGAPESRQEQMRCKHIWYLVIQEQSWPTFHHPPRKGSCRLFLFFLRAVIDH